MRIAHLSTRMDYYGGEVCLSSLAAGLSARGHEVSCVVRPGSRLEQILQGLGIEVEPLPLVDWFEPVSVTRLHRWLMRRGIEILHTHLPRDYFIAAAATWGTSIVNVGSRHQLNAISHPIFKRPFLSRFGAMISVSEAVRDSVLASAVVPSDKVVTIHNGIAASGIESTIEESSLDLRAAAGIGPETPVVGFVGRICPTKGIDVLLRAIALIRHRHPGLCVFLVGDESGDGKYTEELTTLARELGLDEAFHGFGYLQGAEHAASEFDVQVIGSLAEPFGMVTLEAMSCGCPVVVTNSGGSPEIVRDGVEGFHFAPGDEQTLALRLDCLLGSPGLRREMGRRGRQRVQLAFSRRLMLDRTEALYREVVSRSSEARVS